MRTPFVVLLMILAIPLMGSDCAVAARVGGPPPQTGNNPPPTNGGGGGVIIVASGDASVSGADAASVRVDRGLLASMLAVSVWTPPEPASSTKHAPSPVQARVASLPIPSEVGSTLPVSILGSYPSPAVPEPTGFVLFAVGVGVAASVVRARGARGRPASND